MRCFRALRKWFRTHAQFAPTSCRTQRNNAVCGRGHRVEWVDRHTVKMSTSGLINRLQKKKYNFRRELSYANHCLPCRQAASLVGGSPCAWRTSFKSNATFTPGHIRPDTCIPDEQLVSGYRYVDGYKLLVWDTCWLYLGDIITIHLCHGRLVSLCIQQQTADKLATILSPIYKIHIDGDKWIQLSVLNHRTLCTVGRASRTVMCSADWHLSPVSTTRVNGPSWRVTGFHYPSTRAVLTGARFPLVELTAVLKGSGNRSPVN